MNALKYIIWSLLLVLIVFRLKTSPNYIFYNKHVKTVHFSIKSDKDCFDKNGIQWVKKDKEFLYNGFLYDVKSIQYEKDSFVITALEDKSETEWISQLFSKSKKLSSTLPFSVDHFANTTSIFLPEIKNFQTINHTKPSTFEKMYQSISQIVPAPPPLYISFFV